MKSYGKVIYIFLVYRAVMRLCLVYVYKENLVKSPSIKPLNRNKINVYDKDVKMREGFQLKRSGIVVRSIKTSRSVQTRVWAPIPSMRDENENVDNAFISKRMLKLAEVRFNCIYLIFFIITFLITIFSYSFFFSLQTFYIIKPLIHLGCLSATGKTNWQPWFLSLIIDISR